MPARTIRNTHDLMAMVPVDKFRIIGCPSERQCNNIVRIVRGHRNAVRLFTLMTAASESPFQREMALASFSLRETGMYQFTGVFCGKIVSGMYDPYSGNGWFNLD